MELKTNRPSISYQKQCHQYFFAYSYYLPKNRGVREDWTTSVFTSNSAGSMWFASMRLSMRSAPSASCLFAVLLRYVYISSHRTSRSNGAGKSGGWCRMARPFTDPNHEHRNTTQQKSIASFPLWAAHSGQPTYISRQSDRIGDNSIGQGHWYWYPQVSNTNTYPNLDPFWSRASSLTLGFRCCWFGHIYGHSWMSIEIAKTTWSRKPTDWRPNQSGFSLALEYG